MSQRNDRHRSAYTTLRIGGETIDPDTITARLGIQPSESHHKGQVRRNGQYWKHGHWGIESRHTVVAQDLCEHLVWIATQIEAVGQPWQVLVEELWERDDVLIDLFCFWGTEAQPILTISCDLMRRLSDLHLPLGLDAYSLDPPEAMLRYDNMKQLVETPSVGKSWRGPFRIKEEKHERIVSAYLRVQASSLSLDDLTKALKLETNQIFLYQGEYRVLSSRGQLAGNDLYEHLDWLAECLQPRYQELESLQRAGIALDVYAFWEIGFNRGVTIWPQIMAWLDRRSLPLVIDTLGV